MTIWNANKIESSSWINFNPIDISTHPDPNKYVIAVDMFGNMHVCFFDFQSCDFLLNMGGLESTEVKDALSSTVFDALSKLLPKDIFGTIDFEHLEELIFEETCNPLKSSCAYFTDVVAWAYIQAPTMSNWHEVDEGAELTMRTYDVLADIEPALRNAIAGALK